MNSKFKFRRECLDRLNRYKRANIYYQDKKISNWIFNYIKDRDYRVVMLYIPLSIEVNIKDLIKRLRMDRVCFSAIYGR